MNLNLENKVFIVSGSSRGIGKGIAIVLLEEGAKVVLTGRDKESLSSTYDESEAIYPEKVLQHAGDLNDEKVLQALRDMVLDAWGCVDGVVANIGGNKPVNDWDISESDWQWYFNANFHVAQRFVNYFIEELRKSKGSIAFISSIAAIEDINAPLPYSASKAALNAYAKGLSRKLAKDGVRVNTIAPGNIIFEGGSWDKKMKDDPKKVNQMLEDKVLLNRFGVPEEIGCLAAFLLSDKASFVTGCCYTADGGQIAAI